MPTRPPGCAITSLTVNLCWGHLCFGRLYQSPCQHLSISCQLTVAKPWEANKSSGKCPGVTCGAFIICSIGSALVYRSMQPSGAATIIPIAQVSSSLLLYATSQGQLLPLPLNSSPTGNGGSTCQQPAFDSEWQLKRGTCTFYRCDPEQHNVCAKMSHT